MDIAAGLIKKCKHRDRESFDMLLARYEKQLYQLCYGYSRNRDDALDIMQEVYIKVFRSIDQFDENREFYPWLKKIAVNTCLNYRRDHSRHQHLPLEPGGPDKPCLQSGLSCGQDIETEILANDMENTLLQAIRQLPDIYRISLTLRYVEDMSYDSIATTLGIPRGTVKSHISRARQILKTTLKENGMLEV